MTITIHRGSNEIGGTCIEIKTAATKILFDIGLPLDWDEKTIEEQFDMENNIKEISKGASAIFISHYHCDHRGFLDIIDENIPVYVSAATRKIMEIEEYFLNKDKAYNKIHILDSDPVYINNDIKIEPYVIDHSAFGAFAFYIEAEGKMILYTGDVRTHGVKGRLYKNLPTDVDFLIMEGSSMNSQVRKRNLPEYKIEDQFVELFESNPDTVNYIWCSGQNIDRLTKIYKACNRARKIFVADIYVASILWEINKLNEHIPSVNTHSNFKVYCPQKLVKFLNGKNKPLFRKYIYCRLNPQKNKVTHQEIAKDPGKYVLIIRPSVKEFLEKINAPQANVVTSLWSGYEAKYPDFFEWIEEKNYEKRNIHTSGHADLPGLKKIVGHVNPKYIIPVHTQYKELFRNEFLQDVIILEDGDVIEA